MFIENLLVGMVLKSDVRDRSGRLLLHAGTELAEKHLKIFRSWGVLEAEVEGTSNSEAGTKISDEINPDARVAAEALIKPLFIHNDLEHPAIKELLRVCVERKATHAS